MRSKFGAPLFYAFALLLAPAGSRAEEPRPLAVLMITGGVHHDYKSLSPVLANRLSGRGQMKVDVVTGISALEPERLKDVDVLFFNTCDEADVPETLRTAILEFVRGGKGMVAMHCSLWSYKSWPEWASMLGGYAPGHDKFRSYSVTVLDAAHPVMLGLGNHFEITDEPYYVDRRDPKAEVLARTTDVLKDPEGKPREGHEPHVWVKPFGKGRIFVATFGHDDKSQSDERFITLMHNGVRWVARRMPDAPHNALAKGEEQAGFKLLFNGKDLDGWVPDPKHWSVENGEIIGHTGGKGDLKHNQFLIAKEEFGDFFLKFSVKLRNHNSGVQFRSKAYPELIVKGYQADSADGWYGSLYEEGGKRGILGNGWKDKGEKVVALDGWNDMTVRAVGPKITITLNGLTTVEYEEKDPDAQPARGVIALQIHAGPAMEVRFRDIKIQPLEKAEN